MTLKLTTLPSILDLLSYFYIACALVDYVYQYAYNNDINTENLNVLSLNSPEQLITNI